MNSAAKPAVHAPAPRALIADDERLLREQLQARLAECWPELQICGSALQFVRVGFRAGQLAVLEITDSFGQRSSLRFNAFEANAALAASTFQFKPPVGADVIRQ